MTIHFCSLFVVLLSVEWCAGSGSCKQASLCCNGRDSSCVVQKTAINAIIEDLDDKPCYCDHACLKLNDCCSDYREACGVRDCEVSDWGPWSECDSDCGPGSQSRTRHIIKEAHHGGKSCPPTLQKRGCQGNQCHLKATNKAPLKETAMLLPSSFGASRRLNETHDIRKNLRLRNSKDSNQEDPFNEYCIQFEVSKISKACHKEKDFQHLQNGSFICVRCEQAAKRHYLGDRCAGHGVPGRTTRWTSLTNVDCHGKWIRRPQGELDSADCPCTDGASFIFV